MPERIFDAQKFRSARRASNRVQAQVGAAVGVNESSVAKWETGRTTPPPEKLARLAAELGQPLNALFPRIGNPDLTDLRCDAGFTQQETTAVLGTRSPNPLSRAEKGKTRLAPQYEAPLAAAYGVTVEVLLRAQERSFGNDVPEPAAAASIPAVARTDSDAAVPGTPRTIAEKIEYLLAETYAPGERPSDEEISRRGNAAAGGFVLSPSLVHDLRTGKAAEAGAGELGALAAALDAPSSFFSSDSDEVTRIVSGARMLKNGLTGMAARGDGEAMPADLMDFLSEIIDEIRGSDRPGRPDNT
ncbi:helix-turn-helix domain-containing protein [Streptomyces sp. NPDC020800]|uniref:helix-turn-helix domain-containing protein n=1 Tax=Streptomyces sp. NPDC020800 TaxID=3365092 RepID=UPI0037A17D2B